MKKLCSVEGCNHKAHARGWCQTHYSRWFKRGDVKAEVAVRAIGRQSTCCDAKHYANGLCANHYMQQRRRDNPEIFAVQELRKAAKRHGFDPDLIEAHFRAHPGLCDICGRHASVASKRLRHRLAIDHDHQTGVFRGLICDPCNRALGFMGDDPERLETAARYLRRAAAST